MLVARHVGRANCRRANCQRDETLTQQAFSQYLHSSVYGEFAARVIGCWRIMNINNNNKHDNVYGAVIMAEPLREFTRFI